jgi:hypothetical protein
MYNGKLYKCPAMSGLPDFDQQFDLRMDDRQRKLLYSFKPLTADCSEEELQQFVATKDQHIPQCEFCPENLKWHTALGEYREMSKPIFEIKEIKEDDLNQARHSPEWLTTNNK